MNLHLAAQTFDQNSTLEGILSDLILPAVTRQELVLRERGLLSLGMCCLISKVSSLSACCDLGGNMVYVVRTWR